MLAATPGKSNEINSVNLNTSALSLTHELSKVEAKTVLKKFWNDRSGATAIEYGLIGSLIAVAVIGGFSALASAVSHLWGDNNAAINNGLNG
jgi:pilus assembly protein Flp/PilA